MSDFLLIHGAWHGAWCWVKLVPELERAGHRVKVTNLPGHDGAAVDPSTIRLNTYAGHVARLLDECDAPVILVGHSMGGMVITQAAELRPDRIKALVYLAAFLPLNGESLLAIENSNKWSSVPQNLVPDAAGLTGRIRPSQVPRLFYRDCSEEDVRFAMERLVPEPLPPLADPVAITAENFGTVPRYYIECFEDEAIVIEQQRKMREATPCAKVFTLKTSHSPFFSAPGELAETLGEIGRLTHPR